MKKRIRKVMQAYPIGRELIALYKLYFHEDSYLRQSGYFRSARTQLPVAQDGTLLPWMNYAMIEFLKQRLSKEMNVFEYGSGNSTHFLARHSRSVTSLEHNKRWFYKVKGNLPGNATLLYKELEYGGDYSKMAKSTGQKYDVIIVDGKDRVACMREGIQALRETGVLILDDTQRSIYEEGFSLMRDAGFRRIDLSGIKPTDKRRYKTSVFYKKENCFRI